MVESFVMAGNTPVKLAFKVLDPEEGVSDKPPIIFMHGITASKENWKDIPQEAANATNRKVYALDSRNHGDSEWSDHFDFDCMVDDLLRFMDSMKIERAILVGHSMGGIIGIKTALTMPDRVEKLVVEDMNVKKVPPSKSSAVLAAIHMLKAALRHVPEGADEMTAKKFTIDYVYKNLPEEVVPKLPKKTWADLELKQTENGRYSFKFNANAVENMLQNISEVLPENKGVYTGPASFIYGGLSPHQVGEEKEYIKVSFPNAEFVEISNASHKVHSDCPEEFTEALIKFLLKE